VCRDVAEAGEHAAVEGKAVIVSEAQLPFERQPQCGDVVICLDDLDAEEIMERTSADFAAYGRQQRLTRGLGPVHRFLSVPPRSTTGRVRGKVCNSIPAARAGSPATAASRFQREVA
jgi:hypothetical protein